MCEYNGGAIHKYERGQKHHYMSKAKVKVNELKKYNFFKK